MGEIASTPEMRAIVRAQTLLDLIAEMQAKVEPPQTIQQGPANPLRPVEVVQRFDTRVATLEAQVKSLEAGVKSGLHVV